MPYTIDYIRNMVKCGILLGPEAGQALLDEIHQAHVILDEAGIPPKDSLAERIAFMVGRHESQLAQAKWQGADETLSDFVERLR